MISFRQSRAFTLGVAAIAAAAAVAQPAAAQSEDRKISVIAVPTFAFNEDKQTSAGHIGNIAQQVSELIASDLRTTGEVVPLGPKDQPRYVYAEVTAPRFSLWRGQGARNLVTGFVTTRSDGRITFGCYVYDVFSGRELGRLGFVIPPEEWRRAAHRCADTAYSKLTGRRGRFDTRIVYVAESGAPMTPIKRVALMDSDGSNHNFLTPGATTVVTPRLSPAGDRIAFVSFESGVPHVRLLDVESSQHRALVSEQQSSFAPRFSPDGERILFAMSRGGNTDIYLADLRGGPPQRLTTSPGIDTSPSFSPDGQRIVFESDRSGLQQLYVMNADGSDQRRISFGNARYASPVWNPDSGLIGFTRIAGDGMRIGVMSDSGQDEKVLTAGPMDEGPSWSPSGSHLLFHRSTAMGGAPRLFTVPAGGGDATRMVTPQSASDADWSAGASE